MGASFAGLRAAQQLGADFDVHVYDPSPWFEWLPNIHELVSGAKRPADLRLPRPRLVAAAGHRYVRAAVAHLDARHSQLVTDRGRIDPYDWCIVAIGGTHHTHGVRGADRHALPFRGVADCARIGQRLAATLRGREPRSIVIVGGGFEGVEALGELLRRYRSREGLTVHVVEAGPRLMTGVSPRIDRAVRRHCRPYDVRFHCGVRVTGVGPRSVSLANGVRLRSDLTLWTGGLIAPKLLHEAGLARRAGGWADVENTLRSKRFPNVFVAGDAAGLGRPLAKQAFHALDMGECVAANVRRAAAGRALQPFRPSRTPMLVAFGDIDTFLVAGSSVVANPAFAAGKEAVYQLTMAQLDPPSSTRSAGALAARVAALTHRLTGRDT